MSRRAWAVAAVVLAIVVGLLWTPPSAHATDPVRVMLVGDSITQGSAGDFTWRYRLWRHLQAAPGVAVDFVGPHDDLASGSTDYVRPAFDRDHAALWGNTVSFPKEDPQQLATDYQPAVVVILLGLNDLVGLNGSASDVKSAMRSYIGHVRTGSPGVDVVVTRVPGQPPVDPTLLADTNQALTALAAELDTPDQRVVVAYADKGFHTSTPDRVRDTYDPNHPSSRGELKIAAAVSDALASIGVGTPYPRPLPVLPLGPRWGADLSGTAGDRSAVLSWRSAPGTTGEVVWSRNLTAGTAWRARSDIVGDDSSGQGSYALTGLRNGHRYRFRVRPVKGWARATDTSSNLLTLRPHRS